MHDTPARVARAYREIFAGLWQRPEDVLTTTFELGHDEITRATIQVEMNRKHDPDLDDLGDGSDDEDDDFIEEN